MAKKNETTEEVVEPKVDAEQTEAPEVKEEPKKEAPKAKSVKELADEVERGMHGTGRERMVNLGDQYDKVQREVNQRHIKATRFK